MPEDFLAEQFEQNRPRLKGVAYRMLGSTAEADDAVQEAWLRLSRSDSDEIENLPGWLTTVTARICLNMLRARRHPPGGPAWTTAGSRTRSSPASRPVGRGGAGRLGRPGPPGRPGGAPPGRTPGVRPPRPLRRPLRRDRRDRGSLPRSRAPTRQSRPSPGAGRRVPGPGPGGPAPGRRRLLRRRPRWRHGGTGRRPRSRRGPPSRPRRRQRHVVRGRRARSPSNATMFATPDRFERPVLVNGQAGASSKSTARLFSDHGLHRQRRADRRDRGPRRPNTLKAILRRGPYG